MVDPIVERIGGTVIANVNLTQAITLHKPFSNAAAISLHDEANANYQVPVGQKFIITWLMMANPTPATTRQLRLWQHNVVDTAAGTNILDYIHLDNQILSMPVFFEIVAGNFVTLQQSVSDLLACVCVGYEMAV